MRFLLFRSGIFPSNYVQKVVNKITPDEQDSTSPIVIMLGKAIASNLIIINYYSTVKY